MKGETALAGRYEGQAFQSRNGLGASADALRRGGPPRPTKGFGGRRGGALYVSAKRTQFILRGKQHLSICDTMSYAVKFCRKTVGSFWKTNPPERCFGGPEEGNWVVFGHRMGGNACSAVIDRRYREQAMRGSDWLIAASMFCIFTRS